MPYAREKAVLEALPLLAEMISHYSADLAPEFGAIQQWLGEFRADPEMGWLLNERLGLYQAYGIRPGETGGHEECCQLPVHSPSRSELSLPPCLDLERAFIIRAGQEFLLTPVELRIMTLLYQARGRVVSRRILEDIADRDPTGLSCSEPKYHISHLRYKLGDDARKPIYLLTRRGLGYSLNPEITLVGGREVSGQ